MTDALTLAKYIVTKCVNDDCPISNLQLQKILYFIQVDSLKRTGNPVFLDNLEAWRFGPVVPDVYYFFCGYGALSILSTYDVNAFIISDASISKENIDRIIEEKRSMKVWDLVKEAHNPNKAWYKIFDEGKGNHMIIPISLMRDIG